MNGPHESGDIIAGRYMITDYVGEGGMQFVYSAEDQFFNKKIAIKTPKNSSAEKRFLRSAIVAAKVNHPNVAKTFDYIEFENRQYLVEEFIEGFDLSRAILQNIKFLDPYLLARIFHHLAKGLAASHHAGVIHRDLKPTNVMVSGGFQLDEIKITDFGIAKMATEEIEIAVEGGHDSISASQTVVGAIPYMAPEAIETPKNVGTHADIWSIGAMMYELLSGRKPFDAGLKAISLILAATPPKLPNFSISNPQFRDLAQEIYDLILQCLQRDPANRPSADDIVMRCSMFCYSTEKRFPGIVGDIYYKSWGFINIGLENVFFNLDSVYGDHPSPGDRVMLSKFPGEPKWRAHPVVKLA